MRVGAFQVEELAKSFIAAATPRGADSLGGFRYGFNPKIQS